MLQETRVCQNCHGSFIIEPDDSAFYEKMQVPSPTWCPECRMIRRMNFYTDIMTQLHKRKCDGTGKDIVSIYSPHAPFPVYERNYWFSDNWDVLSYGQNYDFSRPFFQQLHELQKKVPRYHTYNVNSTNCEYCSAITNSKDCYLTCGLNNEQCFYSIALDCKECVDCWFSVGCESCYFCINSEKCYRMFFGQYSNNCLDSAFLFNCSGCSHCFGCTNLRNKSYYIFNKPYSKEEYVRIIEGFDIGSFRGLTKCSAEFSIFLSGLPHRFAQAFQSLNTAGDRISHTKNCYFCFDTHHVEDAKYIFLAASGLNNSYDILDGGTNSNFLYEISGAGKNLSQSAFINWVIGEGLRVYYSDLCINSSHLFGCVGLRNKKYCILNKQYTKEEYETLVPKIIAHMNTMPYTDRKGRIYKYGEFFPPELSPFAYNETIAQEYFPLTKNEALKEGYRWEDTDPKSYRISKQPQDLPDHIKDTGDDILNEVIGCTHEGKCNHRCPTAFKVIKEELEFYRRMHLPLPRLCPNCRHYERLTQRNPLKLWHRQCMCKNGHAHGNTPCPNEFETSYSPDHKEIVYCENCYNAEVV